MTLPEVIVALTILAILGAAALRLVVSEMRSVDRQMQQRTARAVGRSSVNYLLSELRMVEPGGVLSATPLRLEAHVPYSLGVSCGNLAGRTVLSLLPSDSATYADALFSGYAWRGSMGMYSYVDTLVSVSPGASASSCVPARITPVASSRLVSVAPQLPATAPSGTAVFLLQRLRYWIGASTSVPGSLALFRTRVLDGVTEELASPFDSSARFRFYRVGADTSEALPPASLGDLRGLELDLTGLSLRPSLGKKKLERSAQRTAIFFSNAQP